MKFSINDSIWEITEVAARDNLLLVDGDYNDGVTHFTSRQIAINRDLLPDQKRHVVLHELTHAWLESTQIEIKEAYTEENLCEFMGLYGDVIHFTANSYFKEMSVQNKKSKK